MDSQDTPEPKSSSTGSILFAVGLAAVGFSAWFAYEQHDRRKQTDAQLVSVQKDNDSLQIAKADLTKQRDELTEKSAALTKKLTAAGEVEKQLKENVSTLEKQVGSLTGTNKQLQTDLGSLKKKLSAIEKERTKLQSELSKATSANQALTKTKEENAKKIGSLEEKVAKLEGDLKNQSTTLATLRSERDRLVEAKKSAESKVAELSAAAEEMKAAAAKKQSESGKLQAKIKSLTEAGSKQKAELEKLKKERELLISDKKALAEQLSEVAAKLEELTKKKAEEPAGGTDSASANAALEKANARTAALTAERDELKRRIAEMARQRPVETSSVPLDDLQTQLAAIRQENARITKAFHDMSAKARVLNEQIAQLEKALGEEMEKNSQPAPADFTLSQSDLDLIQRVDELQRELLGKR